MDRSLFKVASFYLFLISFAISLFFYFNDFISSGEQIQKLILLVSIIVLCVSHKIYTKRFFFYLRFLFLIIIVTILQKLIYGDLLISRAISNFAFLSTGFFLFMIKFSDSEIKKIRVVLSLLPLLSVGIGLLSGHSIFRLEYNGAYRLQGLLVPAHLAMLSSIAIVVNLFLRTTRTSRFSIIIIIINTAILMLTQTRGALLFTLFLTIGYFIYSSNRNQLRRIATRYLFPLLILVIAVPLLINIYQSRQVSLDDPEINTSGRLLAWAYFLDIGYERKYVGYGLGSSTEVTVNKLGALSYFKVPHNEFIKFFVEIGLIGSLFFWTLLYRNLFKNINPLYIKYKKLLFLGLILYALVDNLFSTIQFYIPLMCFFNFINKE